VLSAQVFGAPGSWISCHPPVHLSQPESSAQAPRSNAKIPILRFMPRPRLARFPLERNRSSDNKSRPINMLERILVAKVCQLLWNAL
jgi:hypothetical protein